MKIDQKYQAPGRRRFLFATLLAALAAIPVGCGKQAYVATNSQAAAPAPGSFSVPPKVDVLLIQDDTGSSIPIFANISGQLQTFLANIQTQGWDYHMATIPLTTYRPIAQVLASQYDPNWGSQWIQPYPGAIASQIESVASWAFSQPSGYNGFLSGGDTSSALGGQEPALANLETMLHDASMETSGFLRPDAMLAIVLLSTGDDTSNRNYCSDTVAGNYAQSDGWAGPCDLISVAENNTNPSLVCGTPGANPEPYCNNYQASLQPYQNFLGHFKGANTSSLVRFYPVVSAEHQVTGLNCMGTNAFLGQRYHDMLNAVEGQSFDICTIPIPNVLQSIATNLSAVQLNMFTSFLFMASQPNSSTITVYRNPGGNTAQAVQIPQSATDGWTYAGDVSNVYTTAIGSATATPTLNLGSGWAVQLHGSAIISGTDTATVNFTPYGTQNSAAQ